MTEQQTRAAEIMYQRQGTWTTEVCYLTVPEESANLRVSRLVPSGCEEEFSPCSSYECISVLISPFNKHTVILD